MHRTFEAWADDFHFSDELKELEQQVPFVSPQQAAEETRPKTTPDTEAAEELNLEKFSDLLANVVADKMTQSEFLNRLIRAEELKRDNQLLAKQVKELLRDKAMLAAELHHLEQEMTRFRKVAGNLYLKLD